MDGDCGSWTHQQHFDGQSPDFNSSGAWTVHYLGSQNHLSTPMYPWHAPVATYQGFLVPSLVNPCQTHFEHAEPHGWFYSLPTFRQVMLPPTNAVLKNHLSVESHAPSSKDGSHIEGQQFLKKQLLVFDQTGDQTTMIYGSGFGAPPVHCLPHWSEKQVETSIFHPQHGGSNMIGNADTCPMDNLIVLSECDEDHESDLQSEMHEDTEELNALMYSDDDTDGDDEDEVTSTGHSPSTLTVYEGHNAFAGIGEEVASSDEEPTKRQKLCNAWNGIAKNDGRDTLSHVTLSVDGDDLESHCGSPEMRDSGKHHSLSSKKRVRKDSIRETIRMLQSRIPCEKGVTPVEVIDEAINFLLSLKLKAYALGFDSTK